MILSRWLKRLFDKLLPNAPRQRRTVAPPIHTQDSIKKYGFIYSDEVLSPDGTVKVIYGYNDGQKGPVTIEPRIVDVATGEVLVDLWRNWCQGSVEFLEPRQLRIKVKDAYARVLICEAEIDLDAREFVLTSNPDRREPLTNFRERMMKLRRL